MRPHGTQEQLERRRQRAIALLGNRLTPLAVARKIGCAVSSVYQWKDRWRKGGTAALQAKPVPGRPPKLSARQQQALVQILVEGPLRHGYSTDLWTERRVAEVIAKRFRVRYHPHHMWRLLVGLGWSCQKPQKRARERNEAEIAYWKRHVWPHIKKGQRAWGPSGLSRRERVPAHP